MRKKWLHGFSPSFCWVAGHLWLSLFCRNITPISAFIFMKSVVCFFFFFCVSVSGSKLPLFQSTKSFWIGAYSNNLRGFPGGSVIRNLPANARDSGDAGSIPGFKRSPEEGNGNPLQYSCLENSTWTEDPGGLQSMGLQRVRHD